MACSFAAKPVKGRAGRSISLHGAAGEILGESRSASSPAAPSTTVTTGLATPLVGTVGDDGPISVAAAAAMDPVVYQELCLLPVYGGTHVQVGDLPSVLNSYCIFCVAYAIAFLLLFVLRLCQNCYTLWQLCLLLFQMNTWVIQGEYGGPVIRADEGSAIIDLASDVYALRIVPDVAAGL